MYMKSAMRHIWVLSLLFSAALFSVPAAWAEQGAPDTEAEGFVLFRSRAGVSTDDALPELRRRSVVVGAGRTVELEEFVRGVDPGLGIYGSARIGACRHEVQSSVVAGGSLSLVLGEARSLIDHLEYHQALQQLDEAEQELACIDFVPASKELADLAFLQGVARFFDRHENRALDEFRAALAIDPHYPWDPDLPPPPQRLFESTRSGLKELRPARVVVDVAAGELESIALDGQPLLAWERQVIELVPGRHLLQWRRPGGVLEGRSLLLRPGGEVRILGVSGRVDALAEAPWAGGFSAWLAHTMLSAQVQVPIDFVDMSSPAPPGESPAWHFDPAVGNIVEIPTISALRRERRMANESRDRYGSGRDRFRIHLGAGAIYIGSRPDQKIPRDQVHLMVAGTLGYRARIVDWLRAEVALEVAFDPNWQVIAAGFATAVPRILPGARLGINLAPIRARWQPDLSILALVALERPGDKVLVIPGIELRIGVDTLFKPERGLFLRVDIGLGIVQVQPLDSDRQTDGFAFPLRVDGGVSLGWRQ